MNTFDQSLTDINELEILSKTRQLLKFRLAFASVCLLLSFVVKTFSSSEFNFPLVAAIVVGVITYSLAAIAFIRHAVLKGIASSAGDEQNADDRKANDFVALNAVLLALDIVALTLLIHATNGIESDLYILYLLPILLSSYVFTRLGIYATSFFVSLLYTGLLFVENRHLLVLPKDSLQLQSLINGFALTSLGTLWQRILLRSLIFSCVAFIWGSFCSYMSRFAQSMANRLRSQLRNNQRLMDEMKEVESQLVHQEKMASLGRLVAGIAHELNNPINFVHGNLPYLKNYCRDMKNLIAAGDDLPEPQKTAMQKLKAELKYDFLVTDLDNIVADMEEGVDRIRQIIKNLRSFGRLDEAELKEASINEGIESTLKILGQYYGRDKIPVSLELQEMPAVLCYPGQLNQVWMNLLSNAAQATEKVEEPQVQIQSQLRDGNILISITDNGSGIKGENRSKIFDPFFTTKPVGQGTGLGLSICHSIIQRHHGNIWFEAVPGGGTVFKVSIPLEPVPALTPGRQE